MATKTNDWQHQRENVEAEGKTRKQKKKPSTRKSNMVLKLLCPISRNISLKGTLGTYSRCKPYNPNLIFARSNLSNNKKYKANSIIGCDVVKNYTKDVPFSKQFVFDPHTMINNDITRSMNFTVKTSMLSQDKGADIILSSSKKKLKSANSDIIYRRESFRSMPSVKALPSHPFPFSFLSLL